MKWFTDLAVLGKSDTLGKLIPAGSFLVGENQGAGSSRAPGSAATYETQGNQPGRVYEGPALRTLARIRRPYPKGRISTISQKP